MRRQRTTFAAPFVVVVGCGHPANRPPPEPPIVMEARAGDVHAACTIGDIACKSSKSATYDDCRPIVTAPSHFTARVVRTWVIGDGLGVEIERPAGVDTPDSSWSAQLLDENGHPDETLFVVSATEDRVTAQLYKTCTLPGTNVTLSARGGEPNYTCCTNPPPPPRPPPPPPPAPIEARIIGAKVEGDFTLLTLAKGFADGVDSSWTATLGDSTIPCVVVRVDKRKTLCKVTATDITATKAILKNE